MDKVFGNLRVVALYDYKPQGMRWMCQCTCGKFRIVRASRLARGITHSCGQCSKIKHGEAHGSKEYIAWKALNQRCYDPNHKNYKDYGGRGIKVWPLWRHNFLSFLLHIGRAPTTHHTVDRKDNDGNYEPGNVRWATWTEQANNRRRRRWIIGPTFTPPTSLP